MDFLTRGSVEVRGPRVCHDAKGIAAKCLVQSKESMRRRTTRQVVPVDR